MVHQVLFAYPFLPAPPPGWVLKATYRRFPFCSLPLLRAIDVPGVSTLNGFCIVSPALGVNLNLRGRGRGDGINSTL